MFRMNYVTGLESVIGYGSVPPGCVLNPILFILYINLFSDLNVDGLVVSYVDNTCLLFTDKSRR